MDNEEDLGEFYSNESLEKEEESCSCCKECSCGEDCHCTEDDKCCEECACDGGESVNEANIETEETEQCEDDGECKKQHHCKCEECPNREDNDEEESTKVETNEVCETENYLNDLLRVQAEFDNYRKRMQSALGDARNDGFTDAIEQFIPALDSFKMATDMITDKNTLVGIQFIEKGILDTLNKMGVEVIETTGKFNPEFHHVIDTEEAEGYESGDIIKEVYHGFTYKGKVIRYSQVIVKK